MQATEYINGEVRVYERNGLVRQLSSGLFLLFLSLLPFLVVFSKSEKHEDIITSILMWLLPVVFAPAAISKFIRFFSFKKTWCSFIASERGIQLRDLFGRWKFFSWTEVARIEISDARFRYRVDTMLKVFGNPVGTDAQARVLVQFPIRNFIGNVDKVISELTQIPQFEKKFSTSMPDVQRLIKLNDKRARWRPVYQFLLIIISILAIIFLTSKSLREVGIHSNIFHIAKRIFGLQPN
jgi:hypothetical protein